MELGDIVTEKTSCPRCQRAIKLDIGYEGEGGLSYCCEYTFYWNRVWAVTVTDDNKRSYEECIKSSIAAKDASKESK